MRVFLDAHIPFLAACSATSPVHDLLALGRAGHCDLVASGYAVEEARRNIAVKGPDGSLEAFDQALASITSVPEAGPTALASADAAALADPADVPILAAAIQCRADVLVTGDRRAFGPYLRSSLCGIEILILRDVLRRVVNLPLD